jgi:hypothetical protein
LQYEVQRFQGFGISQELFHEEIMTNFRASVYLVKQPAAPSELPLGRARLPHAQNLSFLDPQDIGTNPSDQQHLPQTAMAASIRVLDRVGYLSSSFASIAASSAASANPNAQLPYMEFVHYSAHTLPVKYFIPAIILPCLHRLSQQPTVWELHEANRAAAAARRRGGGAPVAGGTGQRPAVYFNEMEAQIVLVDFLSFLEQLNLIVFEL